MIPPANVIHTPDVALHFAWQRNLESVMRQGILSQHLRQRLGTPIEAGPNKAQRQIGTDLISIWDPWAFLNRHWRNHPLGSENRPWLILDVPLERYFRDSGELDIARAIRDPNPANFLGAVACQAAIPRKTLDLVRRRLASIAEVAGPAPGVTSGAIHDWIDEELRRRLCGDGSDEAEVCLLLSPSLRKYDFPGYKLFENFVRYRIPPRSILGVVVSERVRRQEALLEGALSSGCAMYFPDGVGVRP